MGGEWSRIGWKWSLYIIRTVNMRQETTVAKLARVQKCGDMDLRCEGNLMEAPVFEEFDPASDCDCPGCAHWRRVIPPSALPGPVGHPAARGALLLAAAAGTVIAGSQPAPAVAVAHGPVRPGDPRGDESDTPQGGRAPLHGKTGPAKPGAGGELPATTRAAIINRAKKWVASQVPYSMSEYWSDGYRQDCSGFVSMAWSLPGNEWTGSLDTFGVRISRDQLQPGDMLLFHNPEDPENGSHVVLFGGWSDYTHTYYLAYEQVRPHTRGQSTPYAYWTNSPRFVPYRYKGLTEARGGPAGPQAWSYLVGKKGRDIPAVGGAGTKGSSAPSVASGPGYPGRGLFRPGADNESVTRLGEQLVKKGFGKYYTSAPGPRWGEADRRGVEAFQRAQGWRGGAADGYPGPETWRRLFL